MYTVEKATMPKTYAFSDAPALINDNKDINKIIEKVNNLDEFRLKNFRETPESYILIDSFNFQAAKKAFKIYLDKTFNFLIGLFQKVSFLKICLLVPNRKLIKYIFN